MTLTPSQDLNSVDGSNSAPAYIIPAAKLTNHTVSHTFMSGPLRSPARIQNTFANEVMMDELAHLAGVDPVNFRLDNLQDSAADRGDPDRRADGELGLRAEGGQRRQGPLPDGHGHLGRALRRARSATTPLS